MISTKLSDGYWNQIKRLQKMLKRKTKKSIASRISIVIRIVIWIYIDRVFYNF